MHVTTIRQAADGAVNILYIDVITILDAWREYLTSRIACTESCPAATLADP